MTPYRISARERRAHEHAPRTTTTSLRLVGALFAIAAGASVACLSLIGGNDVQLSVAIGVWIDRTLAVVVPIVVLAMGVRAAARTPLRTAAFVTGGAWVLALIARFPPVVDSYGITATIALIRVVAVAGLALLPFLAAPRRVVPRWPLFSIIALAAGDAARKIDLGRYGMVPTHFDPSASTLALCTLLAFVFLVSARELSDESIDERADRFGPITSTLFGSAHDRATFLGPVRLATDALVAFSVATLVATTTTVAYSRSFRLDAPPAGAHAAALVVLFLVATVWLKRASRNASYAPVVSAIIATLAATFSAMFTNGFAFSVALLPLGLAVIGLGVVAPRTKDASARTMRRWVTFVSATGVMLASAGFFSIYSYGQGEPFLARLTKLAALVFGVMAAGASARLEGHARIELAAAAEDREP